MEQNKLNLISRKYTFAIDSNNEIPTDKINSSISNNGNKKTVDDGTKLKATRKIPNAENSISIIMKPVKQELTTKISLRR